MRDGRVKSHDSQQPDYHPQSHSNGEGGWWRGLQGLRSILPLNLQEMVSQTGHTRAVGCRFTQSPSGCVRSARKANVLDPSHIFPDILGGGSGHLFDLALVNNPDCSYVY